MARSLSNSKAERSVKSRAKDLLDLSVCAPPPPLSGCLLYAAPDARAIFLHSDLLCNGTCSLTGEGHKRKISDLLLIECSSFLSHLNLNCSFFPDCPVSTVWIYCVSFDGLTVQIMISN